MAEPLITRSKAGSAADARMQAEAKKKLIRAVTRKGGGSKADSLSDVGLK